MNKTILLMIGAAILIAILLVAFDSDIKKANTHEDMSTDKSESVINNEYQAISTELTAKKSIDVIKPQPEPKTAVASQQSSSSNDTSNQSSEHNTNQSSNNQSNNNEQSGDVQQVSESEGAKEMMYMEATAYTAYCDGCSGTTYTGIDLRANPNQKVIAVDPNVIPLGATVWVEGYGTAVAGDIGGDIKGNRIDVFIPSEDEAFRFGRRQVQVKILEY
ncbi:3D (Asp-Asp-Asp) domain-containing protein [Alkalibacillus flavidus]|uniref:3D (Asp-Asp-Asp) domain-containing protein n=1 Tax=Alkalibacillus flavidus TaxID=546021 RepID=A0ABV2KWG0_9BACI